jgi:bifunctional non-homologous end joining protein LigD
MSTRLLAEYDRKRAERDSDEPKDEAPWGPSRGPVKQFAIHERNIEGGPVHEELRFEHGGVCETFIFPKGFSFVERGSRLAVQLEDHPVEWLDWSGEIKRTDGMRDRVRLVMRGELELLMENPGRKFVIRISEAGLREGVFTFSRNFRRKTTRREWFVSRRAYKPDCIDPVKRARKAK